MGRFVIMVDDPRVDDVQPLLARHHAFNNEHTPSVDVHALDLQELLNPAVAFFTGRRDGELLAIGALRGSGRRDLVS